MNLRHDHFIRRPARKPQESPSPIGIIITAPTAPPVSGSVMCPRTDASFAHRLYLSMGMSLPTISLGTLKRIRTTPLNLPGTGFGTNQREHPERKAPKQRVRERFLSRSRMHWD